MRAFQRKVSFAVALAFSATILVGCSSAQSADVGPATVEEPFSTSAPEPATSAPEPLPVTWITMNGSSQTNEGVPISTIVDIDPTVRHVDDVTSDPEWATVLAACGSIDPQRDALVLARIAITAQSNGFDIDAGVNVELTPANGGTYTVNGGIMLGGADQDTLVQAGLTAVDFGVGYDEAKCYPGNSLQLWFGAAARILAGDGPTAEWGPVPVVLIMRGYYGPQHPDSNPAVDTAMQYAMPFLSPTGPVAPLDTYVPGPSLPTDLSGPNLTTLDNGQPAFRLS